MPFHDSSGNYMPQKGKSAGGAKSTPGANSPKAKAVKATTQRNLGAAPAGSLQLMKGKGTKLNKNMAGDNENSSMENKRQKTKYPGKGMQAKGTNNPKAKGRTSKANKQKNLDSGVLF